MFTSCFRRKQGAWQKVYCKLDLELNSPNCPNCCAPYSVHGKVLEEGRPKKE